MRYNSRGFQIQALRRFSLLNPVNGSRFVRLRAENLRRAAAVLR